MGEDTVGPWPDDEVIALTQSDPISTHNVLEARLDMLALAIESLGASLPAAQAREIATTFSERLSISLAQRGEVSADVDAALAAQAGRLMQALRR